MSWILAVCTWGILGVCSDYSEQGGYSEESCYRAMENMYRLQGRDAFLYIKCKPEDTK